MGKFEMLARARGLMVTVELICRVCNSRVCHWTGVVGTVHIDVNDIDTQVEEHACVDA